MKDAYTYDVFESKNERWPEAGDRLFAPGRDDRLAQDAPERNYRLTRGYKRAGDLLIQNALDDIVHHNNLVYPILFCYRHYVELALKDIIDEHDPLDDEKDHDLETLWGRFQKIAQAYGNDITDEAVVAVAACIAELIRMDAGSFSFRYALSRKGRLPKLPNDIDLVHLYDVMNGIENFFECADLDFTSKKNAIAEAAALL